jgi:hypothetical protein
MSSDPFVSLSTRQALLAFHPEPSFHPEIHSCDKQPDHAPRGVNGKQPAGVLCPEGIHFYHNTNTGLCGYVAGSLRHSTTRICCQPGFRL